MKQVGDILPGIRERLIEVDHQYCKLTLLGMQLNYAANRMAADHPDKERVESLKKDFADFTRSISRAALIADKSTILKGLIEMNNNHQEKRKQCKPG